MLDPVARLQAFWAAVLRGFTTICDWIVVKAPPMRVGESSEAAHGPDLGTGLVEAVILGGLLLVVIAVLAALAVGATIRSLPGLWREIAEINASSSMDADR